MKSTLIVTAYKEWRYLQGFSWGIEANKDHLEKILIIHDGPLEEGFIPPEEISGVPTQVIALERNTGNPVVPLNTGFSLVSPESHVVATALDIILSPGCIKQLQSYSVRGRFTTASNIPVGRAPISNYPPIPIGTDFLIAAGVYFHQLHRSWRYMRNGLFSCFAEDWQAIGGLNTNLSGMSYASEEYELGLRWSARFGEASISFHPEIISWHQEDNRSTYGWDKIYQEGKISLYSSRLILAEAFLNHYNNRVHMFLIDGSDFKTDCFNVKHTAHFPQTVANYYDQWLDCWNFDEWIPAGTLNHLLVSMLPLHWDSPRVIQRFLSLVPEALSPSGTFDITLQPHKEITPELVAGTLRQFGAEIDSIDGLRIKGWREEK